MNVFAVDYDPELAAMSLCDQHVVKMVTETAQILSTHIRSDFEHNRVHINSNYHGEIASNILPFLYKSTHKHHPILKELNNLERVNIVWLLKHFQALEREYRYRFDKNHAAFNENDRGSLIFDYYRHRGISTYNYDWYGDAYKNQTVGFPLCMPDQYKEPLKNTYAHSQTQRVLSYRKYYIGEKLKFARWNKRRSPPAWIDDPEEDL